MMNKAFASVLLIAGVALLAACSSPEVEEETPVADWRDSGVCYEIFVRSFYDSDGDGVGDLEGLIQKLDYVNDGDPRGGGDLGANCIWLMPVAESPSYHGYDVTDYYTIDPDYGTNEDFKRLTAEAHRRGITVLVDMVVNHTSDRHPIFQQSMSDPSSEYRDWFRWSPAPGPDNEYGDNNWRRAPEGEGYYYGFFSARMPDLNWETEAVREEMKKASSFWLDEMGADGLRLDAVRHLMEDEEGRSTNVPRTHVMLGEYGEYLRGTHPGSFTVGEVFDGGEALLAYYPDQLDSYFAFGISDAILNAVRAGSSEGLLEAVLLHAGSGAERPLFPVPAQPRPVPHADRSRGRRGAGEAGRFPAPHAARRALRLLRRGARDGGGQAGPAHSNSRCTGRSDRRPDSRPATPWEPLQADSLTANVEALRADAGSILNHYRELIRLRSACPVLGSKAELVPVETSSPAAVAFLRQQVDGAALVVANLGDQPLEGVTLSAQGSLLPAGVDYMPQVVLGKGPSTSLLEVGENGGFQGFSPLETLEPLQAYVLALSACR